MTWQRTGLNGLKGAKRSTAMAIQRTSSTFAKNAEMQAMAFANAIRTDPSSLASNPARTTREEKYDLIELTRNRMLVNLEAFSEHIIKDLAPGLAQYVVAAPGKLVASLTSIAGIPSEIGSYIISLGLPRAHGWKVQRYTDGLITGAKFIFNKAEVVLRNQAPAILTTGFLVQESYETKLRAGSMDVTMVRDEIHRVAETFALDAETLVLLISAAAELKSAGKLNLAANTELNAQSVGPMKLTSGASMKQSALDHTLVDAAGGTIKVVGGVIHLNPVVPAVPDVPVPVPPVVNVSANTSIPTPQMTNQYEGMAYHGADAI